MMKYGESEVMTTVNPILRSDSLGYYEHNYYSMIEKRQLFLRSYQFCRKKSLSERIKGSLARAKKTVCLRLRSALGLSRKMVFSRFKCAFYYRRRRSLFNNNAYYSYRRTDPCFF